MSRSKRPPKHDHPSIKYRWNSTKGVAFKLADFIPEQSSPTSSNYKRPSCKKEVSEEILTTAELISAVDQIWHCANRLSMFQTKVTLDQNHISYQNEDSFDVLERGKSNSLHIDNSTLGQSSRKMHKKFMFLNVTQKMSLLESKSGNYYESFLSRGSTSLPNEFWSEMGIGTGGISHKLGNMCDWLTEIVPTGLKHCTNSSKIENEQSDHYGVAVSSGDCSGDCISGNTSLASNLSVREDNCNSDLVNSGEPTLSNNSDLVINTDTTDFLSSDHHFMAAQDIKCDTSVSRSVSSCLDADYSIDALSSCNIKHDRWKSRTCGKDLFENDRKLHEKLVTEDNKREEIVTSVVGQPQCAFAKKEHAFSGALAGVFVSLCLHPVDTIKTIIQSCSVEQNSVCSIGRSIVSERGLTGLYRGIASNITSSAPISAVYTFTYESVKGALLPLLPKEYCSVAHCMAGGSASVATSFIFTPSERIKQQMQVGSHYSNCWNALVGIIRTGGLPSLYIGWGAVLCRNVPHSMIKFYAYENLKQTMSSLRSCPEPNTLQTIVCGGLAGSTAALFTTPFDVVKTRLQTQIPGSRSQYNGVFQALQEIRKQEGLKGLYRGLIPRLFMYMSQGALFFASYELLKSVFSLEVPKLDAQAIQTTRNLEEDGD